MQVNVSRIYMNLKIGNHIWKEDMLNYLFMGRGYIV